MFFSVQGGVEVPGPEMNSMTKDMTEHDSEKKMMLSWGQFSDPNSQHKIRDPPDGGMVGCYHLGRHENRVIRGTLCPWEWYSVCEVADSPLTVSEVSDVSDILIRKSDRAY